MSKFIFENEPEINFMALGEPAKMHVINNMQSGYVESLWGDTWKRIDNSVEGGSTSRVEFEGVYRVLAKPYTLDDALAYAQNLHHDLHYRDIKDIDLDEMKDAFTKLAASLGDKS